MTRAMASQTCRLGLLVVAFTSPCGAVQRVGPAAMRIINGSEVGTPSNQYSFHALPTADVDSDRWLGCGASIISPTFGISAAHCFGGGQNPCMGPQSVALWIGDVHLSSYFEITPHQHGKSVRVEADLICHPKFDGVCAHGHDVVLLKLRDELPSWVKPVPLNFDGRSDERVGEITTDIGFGITESSRNNQYIAQSPARNLRKVSLTVMSDDSACANVYAGGYGCSDEYSEDVATNLNQQICAGAPDAPERDTCSGDSGSPMMNSHGVQIGIVSYGGGPGEKMVGEGRMCGDPKYPGIYSRVSAFEDFITKHVDDLPSA